jgi:hypothetical protein
VIWSALGARNITTETLATFNSTHGLRPTQEKTGRDACSTLAKVTQASLPVSLLDTDTQIE